MIIAADLYEKVTLASDVEIGSLRPDIVVLEIGKHFRPISATKVIIAGIDNCLSNPKIIGQLYDYMVQLRILHGHNEIFGVSTSYTGWRIV